MNNEIENIGVEGVLFLLISLLLLIGFLGFIISSVVMLWDIFTAEIPFY